MGYFVETKTYTAPPLDKKEILRYAGCGQPILAELALMEESLALCRGQLSYKVCFAHFPVMVMGDRVDFHFFQVESKHLAKNLSGCAEAIVFGATVGLEMDRLIARYSKLSPAKGLFLQAIGAERIESLCHTFCTDMANCFPRCKLRPRFSPGYGDLPLAFQMDIFRILDLPRKIGLTLNESLLMTPSKSVTAIVGLGPENGGTEIHSCAACTKTDCNFRL